MREYPQLVIFDMDGTLTLPALDFDRIRAEIGIESGTILEALEQMSGERLTRAHEIIARHERVGAEQSQLYEGVHEVFEHLRERGVLIAIVTRNSRKSARTVMDLHDLDVDLLYTRDDGRVKPSPEPVLRTCERLSAAPERSWVVGDYVYDIQSGRQAGCRTVLMLGERDRPEFADLADHVIRDLRELIEIFKNGEPE